MTTHRHKSLLREGALRAGLIAAAALISASPAAAQQQPNLAGRSIAVIVGATPGGSTDVSARLIATYYGKYLPGKPTLVVQNKPGARGMTAMNYIANQAPADGSTSIVGSGSQIDPANYRVAQGKYDPRTFEIVGGLSIGGSILMIHNKALPRLTNKSAEPVVMATIGNIPRSGMQIAAWGIDYLGWNARWVAGYRGNPDLMLAFERGEVEMTSFANAQMKPDLYDKTKFTILFQSGTEGASLPSPIPEQAGIPMFAAAMKGKIQDPMAQKAFDYWRHISTIYNWVALPPRTPAQITGAWREAWAKARADKDFIAQAKRIGAEATAVTPEAMAQTIRELAELPQEALEFQGKMLVRQGLKPQEQKKKKNQEQE